MPPFLKKNRRWFIVLLFDSSNSMNRLESAGEIVCVQKKFNYRKDNSTLNKIKNDGPVKWLFLRMSSNRQETTISINFGFQGAFTFFKGLQKKWQILHNAAFDLNNNIPRY